MNFKGGYFSRILLTLGVFLTAFPLSLFSLEVPSDFGRIDQQIKGSKDKTIVFIQLAHVDYGAQKSSAEILRHLVEKEDLRLILVEGGWGDVSLKDMRAVGSEQGRVEASEQYLKDGKISGAEYLSVTSGFDVTLWGIEDQNDYAENMSAFITIEPKQAALLAELFKIETILESKQARELPAAVIEWLQKKKAFDRHELSLPIYIEHLNRLAPGRDLTAYPQLKHLIAMMGSGNEFDPAKVEVEIKELIRAFSRVMTKAELNELEILNHRHNPEEEIAYLKTLLTTYKKYESKIKVNVTNLAGYTRALEAMTENNPEGIFTEIKALEAKIQDSFSLSDGQSRLVTLSERLSTLKRLVSLELSAEEFDTIERDDAAFDLTKWDVILSEAKDQGIDIALLQSWIPRAKHFYQAAKKRELALIENALHTIDHYQGRIVAITVGGFHTAPMVKAFEDAGYSVALVSPKFTPGEAKAHQQKYFEILKYKWGGNTNVSI